MVLSEFLNGKAYTFYTQRVSLNPKKWSLQKFFTELFNYCFPIYFCNQQCTKLQNFVQGNRSVCDYVADLDELFTIVGVDSNHVWIVKLFNGFCTPLRKVLLREHLNPEHTSWKAMVRKAEYQEMAKNVDLRETPLSNPQNNNHRGQSHQERNENHNCKSKGHPSSGSRCF